MEFPVDAGAMSAEERVLAVFRFEKPDRMPRYDSYWDEFIEMWRTERNPPEDAEIRSYYGMDIEIVIPDETPFPSRQAVLESNDEFELVRDGWGSTHRRSRTGKFYEEVEVALPDKRKLDQLEFESPLDDRRYRPVSYVEKLKRDFCVFVKTGGPYLRTSNLRGTEQWLMDLVEDPAFARELAMRVTRQMTAVGLEAIRRYDLKHTGIWFFDDMGANLSPMFSPRTFEQVLQPCYQWMCDQYRAAGVQHMLLHCDGNIEPIQDMLFDCGIQGLHPLEPKAGMDVVALREKYGHSLVLLGGLDNAHIWPSASLAELEAHVMHVLEAGQDGGLIAGAHSIGPDITVERYEFVQRLLLEHKY